MRSPPTFTFTNLSHHCMGHPAYGGFALSHPTDSWQVVFSHPIDWRHIDSIVGFRPIA